MESALFHCGLPEETIEMITQKLGGKQVRITKSTSKHNPIFRRKRDKNICSEYESGKKVEELALWNKLSRMTIWRILKGNNVDIRGERKNLTEAIRMLREAGYNKSQIAEKLKISRPTVNIHMKRGEIQ